MFIYFRDLNILMLCFHKETFTLGMLSGIIIAQITFLFEDVWRGWVGRIRSLVF